MIFCILIAMSTLQYKDLHGKNVSSHVSMDAQQKLLAIPIDPLKVARWIRSEKSRVAGREQSDVDATSFLHVQHAPSSYDMKKGNGACKNN